MLQKLFSRVRIPSEFSCDNGHNFNQENLETGLQITKLKPKFSPVYNPSSNGLVERFIRNLKYKIEESNDSAEILKVIIKNFLT